MSQYDVWSLVFIVVCLLIVLFSIFNRKSRKITLWLALFGFILIGTCIQYLGISNQSTDPTRVVIVRAFFSAVKMIGGDFRNEQISILLSENLLYYIAIVLIQVLVLLYTALVVIGLIGQRLLNRWRVFLANHAKKTYVLLGEGIYFDAFLDGIESADCRSEKNRFISLQQARILVCIRTNDETKFKLLFSRHCRPGIVVTDFDDTLFKKTLSRHSNTQYELVSLMEKDEENLMFIQSFSDFLSVNERRNYPIRINGHFMYSECDHAAFMESVKRHNENIHLFSRHTLVNDSFLEMYPLTQIIGKSSINLSKQTLQKGEYHYFFLGFGKTNRDLLRKIICDNQFPDIQLNYHIYSRDALTKDKLIFYQSARYLGKKKEFETDDYFELPDVYGNISFKDCDVRGTDFYDDMKEKILSKKGYAIFIIALGSDIENIKVAYELENYLSISKGITPYHVFAKTYRLNFLGLESKEGKHITAFGRLLDVFTVDNIIHDKIDNLAKSVHETYNELSKRSYPDYDVILWKDLDIFNQNSNRYVAKNLRTKLNLLGFDYEPSDQIDINEKEEAKAKFISLLDLNIDKDIPGKSSVTSVEDFHNIYKNLDSPRNRMASQEHLRWNAYMIINGWIPMSKTSIKESTLDGKIEPKTKNSDLFEHSCITTQSGLVSLFDFLVRIGMEPNNADKMKYDYSAMDHLIEMIEKAGYSLTYTKTVQ